MNWNTSVVLDGTDLPTTGQQVNTENEPVEGDYSQLCNTGPGQSCVKVGQNKHTLFCRFSEILYFNMNTQLIRQ